MAQILLHEKKYDYGIILVPFNKGPLSVCDNVCLKYKSFF